MTTLPALRRTVAPLRARDDLVVVIDLSRVTFLDASVVSVLAGLRLAVTARGGEVRLLPGDTELVTRILELTGWLPGAKVATGPSGVPDQQKGR